jgi:hypothetical protein
MLAEKYLLERGCIDAGRGKSFEKRLYEGWERLNGD